MKRCISRSEHTNWAKKRVWQSRMSAHFKHSEWARGFSLIYGESVPATPNLGAPAGPGMMAAPLVRSNRTRTRTLCEIRWPEAIWAPAILETLAEQSKRSLSQSRESLLRPHRPWRLCSNTTATPVSPLLALLALCSLWQLYGRSLFDDCCLGCLPLLHLRPFVDWAGH